MARHKKSKAKKTMYMDRKLAGELGRETLAILERGSYSTPDGQQVSLADALERSVHNTHSYPPDKATPAYTAGTQNTEFSAQNQTTLEAAHTFVQAGHDVALLNFASAKNPGGGFQKGALAQEESLARSSGLFACIDGNPMYSYHRHRRDCLYSNYAIYSPGVPVFRHDDGTLLAAPYECAMITSPAVNAGIVLQRKRSRSAEITAAMHERIEKILAIAAHHKHDAIVLGAWGCGVFRNNPKEVAGLFQDALEGPFAGVFKAVTFAVLDYSKEKRIIGPFADRFGH